MKTHFQKAGVFEGVPLHLKVLHDSRIVVLRTVGNFATCTITEQNDDTVNV